MPGSATLYLESGAGNSPTVLGYGELGSQKWTIHPNFEKMGF
jgi:hypothetical protein